MMRIAKDGDLPAILTIYNQAVSARFTTADLAPASLESRREWFASHDPESHPIYVAEDNGEIRGWCSLSPYRAGRMALRHTAEISYYVHYNWHRQGFAGNMIDHALIACTALQIKNMFAIVLEKNAASCRLLEKKGFQRWGFLPQVADFNGEECGHFYYGQRLAWAV